MEVEYYDFPFFKKLCTKQEPPEKRQRMRSSFTGYQYDILLFISSLCLSLCCLMFLLNLIDLWIHVSLLCISIV